MSKHSNRRRNARRRAERRATRAADALAKYGDRSDPIFRHCPSCGASPRVNCRTRDLPSTVDNYHPARHAEAERLAEIRAAAPSARLPYVDLDRAEWPYRHVERSLLTPAERAELRRLIRGARRAPESS